MGLRKKSAFLFFIHLWACLPSDSLPEAGILGSQDYFFGTFLEFQLAIETTLSKKTRKQNMHACFPEVPMETGPACVSKAKGTNRSDVVGGVVKCLAYITVCAGSSFSI